MKGPIAVLRADVFNVQVGVFRSSRKCFAYLTAKGVPGLEPETRASFGMARMDEAEDGTGWFTMVITKAANEETKVHECVHMADFIMARLGIPTGAENSEVRAYLTAHLYGQLAEALE